jgi:hypothetical protein
MSARKLNVDVLNIDHNLVKLWEHFPSEDELPLGMFLAYEPERISQDGRYLLYRWARETKKVYGRGKRGTQTVLMAYYIDLVWAKRATICMAGVLNESCSVVDI